MGDHINGLSKKRKPLTPISAGDSKQQKLHVSTKGKSKKEINKSAVVNVNEDNRRAGTINRIALQNFMCHSHLDVDLTSNISLLYGGNGSGKSAILTALIVGLGGKTSSTSRGSSIKSFIRAGESHASIQIDLHNGGFNSFYPKEYGSTISIVKSFTATGSSTCRIKGGNGQIMGTTLKELRRITSFLHIQVDNPICLLNQDVSRNFLSSSDPRQKFTLFMQATGLDILNAEYEKAQTLRRDSREILERNKSVLTKLQHEMHELRKKIEAHKNISDFRNRKVELQRLLTWAHVIATELEVEELIRAAKKVEEKFCEVKEQTAHEHALLVNVNETIEELERKMSELQESVNAQKKKDREFSGKLAEVYEQRNAKKIQLATVRQTIQNKTNSLERLQKDITNFKENQILIEKMKQERAQKISQLTQQKKELNDRLQTTRNDVYQLQLNLSTEEDAQQGMKNEIRQIEIQLANDQTQYDAHRRKSLCDYSMYGRDMNRVKQAIAQNRNKFKHEPRGPLGSYLRVKDSKWVVAIEGYIGPGTLLEFIVDNGEDCKLLRRIFEQTWTGPQKPGISTIRFTLKKYDVSRGMVQAPPDCASMHDVIDVEDPIAFNYLVDMAHIQSQLLIPSDERATELLSVRSRVPRNCAQGITPTGDLFLPAPNYRSYASRYNQARFLQIDRKEFMRKFAARINDMTVRKDSITSQLRVFQEGLRGKREECERVKKQIESLNSTDLKMQQQLKEMQATREPEGQNIEMLKAEVEEVRKEIANKTAVTGQLVEEIKELKTKILELTEKHEQMKQSTGALQKRVSAVEAEVDQHKAKQQAIQVKVHFMATRLTECENKLSDAQIDLANKKAALQKELATATGERPDVPREKDDIREELNDVETRIAKFTANPTNLQDLVAEYNVYKSKNEIQTKAYKDNQLTLSHLNDLMTTAQKIYVLSENYFIQYVKISFVRILELRKFRGSIEIDVKQKHLVITVYPLNDSGPQKQSTSTLSGGERSFSTVAFLYSLWQCMDFPFYFLDEFDVYMDKQNRSKVIDILVNHAKTHPNLQFVFLTPQDISYISEDVRVLRLSHPKGHGAT